MKKKIMILSLCTLGLFALVAFIFNSEVTKDPLALSPVVGKRISTPTGTLISCDLKALKDTVDIPLSYLTEELQIVKLDNRDEALIGGWVRTTVSDNYILVSNKSRLHINCLLVTANLLLLLELMEKVRTSMPIPMPSNWMKRMTVSISYPGRVISYWYST